MHPRSDAGVPAEGPPEWPAARKKRAQLVLRFVKQRGEAHPREVDTFFSHGRIRNYWGGLSSATTDLLAAMHYRGMMKASQNLYAETLLKTMGAEIGMPSVSGGREAVRSVLESWNIIPAGLIMIDGSGLSRYNLVTPESLVALLTRIDRNEQLRGPFEDALPVAGKDGTLEGRMKNTAAEKIRRLNCGSGVLSQKGSKI